MNKAMEKNTVTTGVAPAVVPQGYDPELLFVECGRCGAPVLWEHGQATHVLESAGIDPLELDAHCILVSDGCPACSTKSQYTVQIFRVEKNGEQFLGAKKFGRA